jgi:hypothetical protein
MRAYGVAAHYSGLVLALSKASRASALKMRSFTLGINGSDARMLQKAPMHETAQDLERCRTCSIAATGRQGTTYGASTPRAVG